MDLTHIIRPPLKSLFFCQVHNKIYPFHIFLKLNSLFRLVRWPWLISIAVFLYPLYYLRALSMFFIDCFLCVYVVTYESKWHDSVAFLCGCKSRIVQCSLLLMLLYTDFRFVFFFSLHFHGPRFSTIFYALYFPLSDSNNRMLLRMFKNIRDPSTARFGFGNSATRVKRALHTEFSFVQKSFGEDWSKARCFYCPRVNLSVRSIDDLRLESGKEKMKKKTKHFQRSPQACLAYNNCIKCFFSFRLMGEFYSCETDVKFSRRCTNMASFRGLKESLPIILAFSERQVYCFSMLEFGVPFSSRTKSINRITKMPIFGMFIIVCLVMREVLT